MQFISANDIDSSTGSARNVEISQRPKANRHRNGRLDAVAVQSSMSKSIPMFNAHLYQFRFSFEMNSRFNELTG